MKITNILIVSPEYKEIKKLIDEKDVQKIFVMYWN